MSLNNFKDHIKRFWKNNALGIKSIPRPNFALLITTGLLFAIYMYFFHGNPLMNEMYLKNIESLKNIYKLILQP